MTLKQKRDETFLSQEAPQEHQELLELQKALQKLNRRYYQAEGTKLLLEDSVYDAKYRRLQALEEKCSKLVTETSPTQTIGTPPNKAFFVFKHPHPMLSLENAMDETELN